MLVLSRKLFEKVVIGEGADAITIVVADIDRGTVRLGISAPKEVRVLRAELLPAGHPLHPAAAKGGAA